MDSDQLVNNEFFTREELVEYGYMLIVDGKHELKRGYSIEFHFDNDGNELFQLSTIIPNKYKFFKSMSDEQLKKYICEVTQSQLISEVEYIGHKRFNRVIMELFDETDTSDYEVI